MVGATLGRREEILSFSITALSWTLKGKESKYPCSTHTHSQATYHIVEAGRQRIEGRKTSLGDRERTLVLDVDKRDVESREHGSFHGSFRTAGGTVKDYVLFPAIIPIKPRKPDMSIDMWG
jgi:hypothetical protein